MQRNWLLCMSMLNYSVKLCRTLNRLLTGLTRRLVWSGCIQCTVVYCHVSHSAWRSHGGGRRSWIKWLMNEKSAKYALHVEMSLNRINQRYWVGGGKAMSGSIRVDTGDWKVYRRRMDIIVIWHGMVETRIIYFLCPRVEEYGNSIQQLRVSFSSLLF